MVPGGFCSISIPVLPLPTLTKRAAMPMDGRQTPVCGPCVVLQIVSWHFVTRRRLMAQLHDFYPKMETALAEGLARRLGVVPASDIKCGQDLCRQFLMRHAFCRSDLTKFCMISGEACRDAETILTMSSLDLPTACPALSRQATPTTLFLQERQRCR